MLELGEMVTYPAPCPCIVRGVSTDTVSWYRFFTKLAVTVTLVLLVLVLTVHVVLVSLQVLSDQPANRYPADVFGLARSVTDLPQSTVAPPLTVPPAVAEPVTLQRLTKPALTLIGVGEPPVVPTRTTQLALVPQPPPVHLVNR